MLRQQKSFLQKRFFLYASSLFLAVMSFLCPYQIFSQNANINIDFSPWAAFVPSIKQCSLGQYTLPNPVVLAQLKLRLESVNTAGPDVRASVQRQMAKALVTYEIYGWKKSLCHVIIRDVKQNTNLDSYFGPLGFDCNFTLQDLEELATNAERLASGQLLLTGEDPTANIKGRACKALVEALPPSPNSNVAPPVYFIK